jgi:hypothetical protein
MQDKAVDLKARMRRFKIGVTDSTIIDEIPPTGSVEELLLDQSLHDTWP